jgi:hypothetical protein
LQNFASSTAFPDELHIGLARDHLLETGPHNLMIVGDDHAKRWHAE